MLSGHIYRRIAAVSLWLMLLGASASPLASPATNAVAAVSTPIELAPLIPNWVGKP
jgi:hypothetical protein